MWPTALSLLIARAGSLLIRDQADYPFWIPALGSLLGILLLWFLKKPRKELGFFVFLMIFLSFDAFQHESGNGVLRRISGEVTEAVEKNGMLTLRIENGHEKIWARLSKTEDVKEGDRILAGGFLIPVKKKNYFYSEGFTHTGRLSWLRVIQRPKPGGISGFFSRYFSFSEFSYLHAGFVLGKRGGVPRRVLELFRENGVMHILAISGSHVVIIISFILFLVKFLPLTPKPALWLTLLILWIYLHLLDYSPAPARAIVFTTVLGCAKLLDMRVKLLDVLYFSGFLILFFSPKTLYSLGFLLSFAATFGIIFCMPLFSKLSGKITLRPLKITVDAFLVGVSAQLLIFPLLLTFFDRMNLFSLFLTLPLSLLFIPMLYWDLAGALIFLVFESPAVLLLKASDWLNRGMLLLMEKSEPLKFMEISGSFPPWTAWVVYLILLAFLIFLKKRFAPAETVV